MQAHPSDVPKTLTKRQASGIKLCLGSHDPLLPSLPAFPPSLHSIMTTEDLPTLRQTLEVLQQQHAALDAEERMLESKVRWCGVGGSGEDAS